MQYQWQFTPCKSGVLFKPEQFLNPNGKYRSFNRRVIDRVPVTGGRQKMRRCFVLEPLGTLPIEA